ncbi:p53-induced death domain-containing protein 1 isoform X2 [Eucyclogobius newberryi]|uniref:p53-induced death domain-containing protein 1 isoform X2 n=1 Tax=Eucyclogobius newberryi TaxID=166745 RepID=UPI003B5BD704
MESTSKSLNADDPEELEESERDETSATLPPSPCSLMDCSFISPNLLETKPSSPSSGSSSSVLSLSPPLPPSVDITDVMSETRLTLDVYRGGAAALPLLWGSVPHQLKGLQYLRLGSEEKLGTEAALDVLPHLTDLLSLLIRGHRFYDAQGDPLPGLLTTLPQSMSALSFLTHLDISFNQLSSLPSCLLHLPALSSLVLCHNRLSALPPDMDQLSSLTFLSLMGNQLVSLPQSLGQLKALQTLDVSYNLLQQLPDETGSLESLVKLELSHNKLKELPETMGSLLSLRELVINSNDLRVIPQSLKKLPQLKIDSNNNPLGQPLKPSHLPLPEHKEPKLEELHLGYSQHSFWVPSAGCHVFLPGGAELLFPPECLHTTTRLQWAWKRPERKWVHLEDHEILLSRPLELSPHGISFLKPVEVCVPYHRSRRKEIVVRKFDGQSWSILTTVLKRGSPNNSCHPGGRPALLACCSIQQFSWFMVVSRLVRDTCSVTAAGALLVSTSDPAVKLTFPQHSTLEIRTITLQVLPASPSEVQSLCGDPQATVSPLLCLSQTPNKNFLQPVKVQIPLPAGVTGHSVDRSCLHLLHGDPTAQTWTDITSQVSLEITQIYAIFYITHFSWYWLWYTTQRCVSGVVRKVYQRLKQFKVQFLVMQKKTDPPQVLLQCLPANKVDSRVQSLLAQYDGPHPSDLCDLLEGEQFFAGFERGLDISTDSPDCVEGRLRFVFYSSLKNLKEVFISPAAGQAVPVRGQVSFYRGDIPESLPEEVARKRKGLDSQWLATLPLRLPALNSENNYIIEEPQYPPLNLGDPESGYLTETNLLNISLRIGKDWQRIGMNLDLTKEELERIQYKHKDNLHGLVLDMLFCWARGQKAAGSGSVSKLMAAMMESGRTDLAEEINDIVSIGKRKYSESLRRVGLEAGSPSVSETQQ